MDTQLIALYVLLAICVAFYVAGKYIETHDTLSDRHRKIKECEHEWEFKSGDRFNSNECKKCGERYD